MKLRKGSPYWQMDFQYLSHVVRQSTGTTDKVAALALARRERDRIFKKVKLGIGDPTAPPTMILGQAARRYYTTHLEPTGTENALYNARLYIKGIVDQFAAGTQLTDPALAQHEVAQWRDGIVARGCAPSTANRCYTVLRAIMNMAREQWQVAAPEYTLKQLKEPTGRVRWLNVSEEAALLGACSHHVRDFVTFLMDSGCRKSEGRFLEWPRIAWESNPNWHPHENPQAVVTLHATETKSRRPRRVPLPKRTTAIIKRLRDEYCQRLYPDADPASALALAKIKGDQPTGRVFMYKDPAMKEPTWRVTGDIKKGFSRACQRAGIADFTIHDLRHHYASRLAQAGRSLQDIRDLLGHANIKMTERYAHLCRTNLSRAVDALDA